LDAIRDAAPELETIIVTDSPQWESLLADSGGNGEPWATWDESPGFWLCTSGSTGRPKLAMHRHIDLRITADTYAAAVLGIGPDDRCYSVGPMFHAYGLGNSLSFPFSVGATAIVEPTRPPTPDLVGEVTRSLRPSLFYCIPTFYAALCASDLPGDTFASVRWGVSAAEPLPAETFHRFEQRFGVQILDGIGSTEMTHIYLSNNASALRPGTSGQPVAGYQVEIVDDNGLPVPDDTAGHLEVAGESMATGYWSDVSATRYSFRGGRMRSGDMYSRSLDGFYTYLGRSDDMLKVAGEWVSPAEVEAVLIRHPAVLEAAVVGYREDGGTQRPAAFVVATAGASIDVAELDVLCKSELAGFKRPRRVFVVDELPKTATGKVQRFRLRERANASTV
jgi:benzoate-CoA ligase